jgi:hypothetical protein
MKTAQEETLFRIRNLFGKSAFTEDHRNFRQVGYQRDNRIVSAIGETWEEAIRNLEKRA